MAPKPWCLVPCPLGLCYAKNASPSPTSSQRTFCPLDGFIAPKPFANPLGSTFKLSPMHTVLTSLRPGESGVLPWATGQPPNCSAPFCRPRPLCAQVEASERPVDGKESIPLPVVLAKAALSVLHPPDLVSSSLPPRPPRLPPCQEPRLHLSLSTWKHLPPPFILQGHVLQCHLVGGAFPTVAWRGVEQDSLSPPAVFAPLFPPRGLFCAWTQRSVWVAQWVSERQRYGRPPSV